MDTKMSVTPIRPGKGLEKVDEWLSKSALKTGSQLLEGALSAEDLERVSGLTNVMATRWMFGQCSRERFVTPTRNGFANLRFQASSTIRLIIFLQGKIPQVMGKSLDDVLQNIQTLSKEDADLAISNECVYEIRLEPWDLLWLPAGSICLEETVSGHLNYGVKIPMIMRTPAYIDHYTRSAELAEANEKASVEKMKEVCVMLADKLE